MSKEISSKRKEDLPVEQENQFILRMPEGPSQELRKLLRSGSNSVKDRLKLSLENDMRHGTVRFDNWIWPTKLLDLPSVIESYKTIDRKTFYKAADISQMLLCKEDDDSQTEDEDSPKKKDKKEMLKVEKKYHYPHGITPPLKNVRKRRFRKTLKKKYVDAPEIEKEVKKLFSADNDAVNVKWEVITDEDDGTKSKHAGESVNEGTSSPGASGMMFSTSQSLDIAEHDIFGEVVSSSDDEGEVNIVDSGEDDISRLSGSNLEESLQNTSTELVTQFSKKMLQSESPQSEMAVRDSELTISNPIQAALEGAGIMKKEMRLNSNDALAEKLEDLSQQLREIRVKRQAREQEIASIENQALKQRFQSYLDDIIAEEKAKQNEYDVIYSCFGHH